MIREYREVDCAELAELFYNTVHTVNAKDYTEEQLAVWATGTVDLEKWNQTFQEHYSIVAVENEMVIGFGDIDKDGYLDRLFVHRDYQKKGIAAAICDVLEQAAPGNIITHASITARPFFEKRGYTVIKEQQVERQGITLTNYVMEKTLNDYEVIRLLDKPEIKEQAAQWFHERWGIPVESYLESMEDCLTGSKAVPQWYVAMEDSDIIGGLGVIENDFHDRKDLAPNVCAVYTDEDKRCSGIAGALLKYACADMKAYGIDTLYLVTDHSSFYERYGWKFLCMVQGDGEPDMTRMYIHRG